MSLVNNPPVDTNIPLMLPEVATAPLALIVVDLIVWNPDDGFDDVKQRIP